MIQATLPKQIETIKGNSKILGGETLSSSKKSKIDSKVTSDTNEFASELESQINSFDNFLNPLEISNDNNLEQFQQSLKNNIETEVSSPKFFDPKMTKEVEKLTAPQNNQAGLVITTGTQLPLFSKNKIPTQVDLSKMNSEILKGESVNEPLVESDVATESSKNSNDDESNLIIPSMVASDSFSFKQSDDNDLIQTENGEKLLLKKPEIQTEINYKKPDQIEKIVLKNDTLEPGAVKSSLPNSLIIPSVLTHPSSPNGRHPAILTSTKEVDPQLLSNEDFINHKNIVTKKINSNPYGLKPSSGEQKILTLDTGTSEIQTLNDIKLKDSSSVNSQQFILGLQAEKNTPQNLDVHSPVKVFEMNKVKTTDANEIMSQITDYIIQAKTAKEPTVNMRVNHTELGFIDISVSKTGTNQDAIAVSIGTHSLDGKNFFQQNTKDLFSHLNSAGLSISDFKVDASQQSSKSDFDFGSQSNKSGYQGNEKQFGSEQNQRRHESDRRQELWKLLNKEAA
jgi:hypothetical protein